MSLSRNPAGLSTRVPRSGVTLPVPPYLEMGHEMRSITLDLLVGRYGTKDNFGEFATVEWTVCDSSVTYHHQQLYT